MNKKNLIHPVKCEKCGKTIGTKYVSFRNAIPSPMVDLDDGFYSEDINAFVCFDCERKNADDYNTI